MPVAAPAPKAPKGPPATPTPPVPPTPLERVLRVAHDVRGPEVLRAATDELARATEQAESTAKSVGGAGWAESLRRALRERELASATLAFVESLDGGEPKRIPTDPPANSYNTELVRAYLTARGPQGLLELITRAEQSIRSAETMGKAHGHRLTEMKTAVTAGTAGVASFLASATIEQAEIDRLAKRAHDHRNSLAALMARLTAAAPAALGDPHDLRTSIRESQIMCRSQDSRLTTMASELLGVEAELQRLAAEGVAGRLAAEIESRRESVVESIRLRKLELASVGLAVGSNLLERALQGQPSGLAELHQAIVALPRAFPDGLADRITAMLADAVAGDAAVWAEMI